MNADCTIYEFLSFISCLRHSSIYHTLPACGNILLINPTFTYKQMQISLLLLANRSLDSAFDSCPFLHRYVSLPRVVSTVPVDRWQLLYPQWMPAGRRHCMYTCEVGMQWCASIALNLYHSQAGNRYCPIVVMPSQGRLGNANYGYYAERAHVKPTIKVSKWFIEHPHTL